MSALRQSIARLERKDRTLLKMRFGQGASVDELATMFGMHRATVYRRLNEAAELVRRDALGQLADELKLDENAVKSVVRALGGHELPLTSVLRIEGESRIAEGS